MIFALEGLRGFAALVVALFHGWDSAASPWFRHGWICVDLFFVISGYVMSHTYCKMNDWAGVRSFGIKRFGRLYPLHLFTLAVFIAAEQALQAIKLLTATGITTPNFDLVRPWSLLSNLLLLNGIGVPGERHYNSPSWSISAELWTYAIFALTCAMLAGRARVRTWILLAVGALGAWTFAPHDTAGGLFRCMWAFFLGACLPLIRARLSPSRAFLHIAQLLALAVTLAMVLHLDTPWVAYAMALPFSALVLSVSFDDGVLARLLRGRFLQLLGRLSYSVYMTHWVVLVFFNPLGPRLPEPYASLLKIPYVLAVLGVSLLTYRWIEVPWRHRFRAIANERRALQAGIGATS